MRPKEETFLAAAAECSRRAEQTEDPLLRATYLEMAADWIELASLNRSLQIRHEQMQAFFRRREAKPAASDAPPSPQPQKPRCDRR